MDFMDKDRERDKDPGSGAGEDVTAVSPAPAPAVQAPADLAAAYEKVAAEKQELHERVLRKQAELENFRKRVQREKDEFMQHATADLVRALLPTLDGLERALKHRDESVPEQFYKGMELIYRQLLDVLTRAGLTPVETEGKLFDPHYHEAVERVEAPGHREHEIVEELQRGYKLNHRLLRPAIVKVAVAPKQGGPSEKPASSRAGG
ncbi:MAG TPA: nucleotide exchange factor GrpE [Candidatus Binatia bacterium]|nr:nucleotide exchange factor GrpE [Candidatus Binatia bacterium]